MKTFHHSGKLGDVIFSLPTMRELGGGILYLPESSPDECPHLYSNLKDLLILQPYIHEVREYPSGLPYMQLAPGIHIDYDLDRHRLQPSKGLIHIVKRFLDTFDIKIPNWKDPWLVVDDVPCPVKGEFLLINFTNRHLTNEQLGIKSRVDWKQVYYSIEEKKYFVGTEKEHEYFCKTFGPIDYIHTENVLELARVVRDAKKVYCNQSLVLALSQSLGKTYFLDVKPGKRNCLIGTPNENIL
jgi:hypothetical protein